MEPVQSYHHLSEGNIEVWGNSVKIKEDFFVLNKKQQSSWAREQFTEHRINSNKKYEYAYQEMVLEYGLEYANKYFRKPESKKKQNPPKRVVGDITEFSDNSRRRMLKRVNKADLKQSDRYFFVTLTYPNKYPTHGALYKTDLDVFFKRFYSRFGALAYLWKLEAQRRGAPHYHIIIDFLKLPKLQFLKEWVSKNWFEVVHRNLEEKDEKHLRAGTNIKRIKSARHLISYIAKYLSKDDCEKLENQGRFWGASRNWGKFIVSKRLTALQHIRFRRTIRRLLESQNSRIAKKISSMPTIEVFLHWKQTIQVMNWCLSNY